MCAHAHMFWFIRQNAVRYIWVDIFNVQNFVSQAHVHIINNVYCKQESVPEHVVKIAKIRWQRRARARARARAEWRCSTN